MLIVSEILKHCFEDPINADGGGKDGGVLNLCRACVMDWTCVAHNQCLRRGSDEVERAALGVGSAASMHKGLFLMDIKLQRLAVEAE